MKSTWSRATAVAVVLAILALPAMKALAGGTHDRYMVMASHTKEECLNALDEVKEMGGKLLAQTDWGCMAGDHTGYLVMEAHDEAALKKMLPASWSGAKLVKLNKFTSAQIESFHKK